MKMRAIICAAGDGRRWNNYMQRRKHLIEFDGQTLVARQVEQLRARGLTDIVLIANEEAPYYVSGARTELDRGGPTNVAARIRTAREWSHVNRTLILWGDAYFTDAAMDLVVQQHDGWVQFARLAPSAVTGKPGPEIFAVQFGLDDHDAYEAALHAVDEFGDGGHSSWSVYSAMVGKSLTTPPSEIRDWGMHVEVPDDGTDDFDFGDDYERFSHRVLGRSGRRCTAADFDRPWFKDRTAELACSTKLHRKLWEHCSIAQAYVDRVLRCDITGVKAVDPAPRALGFGVGKEALPAWLAANGATVTATDRPERGVWLDRQHASGPDSLRREGICTEELFRRQVEFRQVDMREIPSDLHGKYDFTWSSSCLEHLGSIEAGIEFFCQQMRCLKRGGVAAHTTEYDFSTNGAALESRDLSLFRQRDLAALERRLRDQGDRLWPLDLVAGEAPADLYVDREPYRVEPHINLEVAGHQFTSVLLIAARGY